MRAISAGGLNSLFLRTDGTVLACGYNFYGQLGDGTTVNRASPVPVLDGAVAATAGGAHLIIHRTDGSVWTLGHNSYGQLGDGSSFNRPQIAPITVVLASAPPALTTAGVDEDVTLVVSVLGAAPSYQWYAGETGDTSSPVAGATQRFLVVPPGAAPSRFWLHVYNPWHSADTGTLVVQPGLRPSIRTQSWQPHVNAAGIATLTVDARGAGLGYQWYEGPSGDLSRPVVGANSATLITPTLTASARYWVRVTNEHGHVDGVSIRVRLAERTAIAGGSHTLLTQGDGAAWSWGYNFYGQLGVATAAPNGFPNSLGTDVASVAAGLNHTLLLKSDGSVWAAGRNVSGQRGDGSTTDRLAPVSVLSDVSAVAAGAAHSLFLKTDGTVWACGENSYGQLGDGTTTARLTPVQIASGARAIAAGLNHGLILDGNGDVWAWGRNSAGQLGNGGTTDLASPTRVFKGVTSLAAGAEHSVFLRADGSVWTCGNNTYGQLGDRTNTSRLSPAFVDTGIEAVAAGHHHTLLLRNDSVALACGRGNSGQLGLGATASESIPREIMTNVRSFSGGEAFTLLVKTDDSVWAAGLNINRQLGDGSTTQRNTPWRIDARVTGQSENITVLSGERRTLSITTGTSNLIYQWFRGAPGDTTQLIPGATQPSYLIPSLDASTSFWVLASNGWSSVSSAAFVVTHDPRPNLVSHSPGARVVPGQDAVLTAQAYGPALSYQWYAGERGDTSTPAPGATTATFTLSGAVDGARYWVRVSNVHGQVDGHSAELHVGRPLIAAAGSTHSIFLKPDGTVWAVGGNSLGQLGDGTTTLRSVPVPIMTGVFAVSVADGHSLFLKSDGSVWAAGENTNGKLGDGTATNRPTPVRVLENVRALSAGPGHSIFIKNDGGAWACGTNSSSELGLGDTRSRQTPVEVMSDVSATAAGYGYSFFLKDDATVWAVGANNYGQLGTGDTTSRANPVKILDGIRAVSTSKRQLTPHSLFLKLDGIPLACGNNSNGQLGNGALSPNATPSALTLTGVRALVAGANNSFFLLNDGTLWACGANNTGQFGIGSAGSSQPTPIQIATNIASFATGVQHSFFVRTDGGVSASGQNTSRQLGDGTTTTRLAPLPLQPVITTPLARLNNATDLARLQIAATPSPTLSYQWFRGPAGNTDNPVAGTTATLSATDLATATAYWVRVSNWLGQVDSLAVTLQPRFTVWAGQFAAAGFDGNPGGDFDGDGMSNLLEYALDSDPTGASPAALPAIATALAGAETRLTLAFRRAADPDLLYEVQAGDTLSDWQTIWSSTGTANAAGLVTVTDDAPLSAHPRRFLRLQVSP